MFMNDPVKPGMMEDSMTRVSISCLVGVAVVLAAASAEAQGGGQGRGGRGPAAPACTTLACDVQADWARSAQTLIAIADAMPDDKWSFKATPAQRTFGEQVVHIVQVDGNLLRLLGGKATPPTVDAAKAAATKAASMDALRQSFAWGDALLKELNDQQLIERVPGAFLGTAVPRLRIVYFTVAHSQDIYGQMAVYLRLNGVTPPASNRP